MKKVFVPAIAILAVLLVAPILGECDATDSEVMHSVTFIAGDRTVMTIYVYEGDTLSQLPGVPEGYSGWDTDLSQPVYEDIVVHAIPEGDHTLLYILIALTLAMLSVVIAVSNLRRM